MSLYAYQCAREGCSTMIEPTWKPGRRRDYCSPSCRDAAYRARNRQTRRARTDAARFQAHALGLRELIERHELADLGDVPSRLLRAAGRLNDIGELP